MQSTTYSFRALLIILLSAPPILHADLIGVTWDFDDGGVYRIDETTGAAELIGYSGLSRMNSLAQDSRGVVYTAGVLDTGTELVDVLATIDPLTGVAHVVAPLSGQENDGIHSMTFSPDGILYGYQPSPDRIVTIDPVTAEVTFIAAITSDVPVGGLQGLEIGPDGLLYGWGVRDPGQGGLVLVDPETGVIVDVDPNVGGPPVQSLVWLEDGTLLGHWDSSRYCPPSPFPCTEEIEGTLLRVDPLTGATTLVGTNIAGDIRGLAVYRIPEIPEILVQIDIKPDDDLNAINPGSKGVIPVAILSSEEFDATTVNPSTVLLEGAEVAVRGKGKLLAHVEDVNGDELPDLICQVETESLTLNPDVGEVWLIAETQNSERIVGSDVVLIVPDAN